MLLNLFCLNEHSKLGLKALLSAESIILRGSIVPDNWRSKPSCIGMMRRRFVRISVSEHLLDVSEGGGCEGGCGEGGCPGIAASSVS